MKIPRVIRKKIYPLSNSSKGLRLVVNRSIGTYASLKSRLLGGFPQADFGHEKIISTRFKFIYISIPKVATRSLIAALVNNPQAPLNAYIVEKSLDRLLKKDPHYQDYYIFTFVRNPWSRVWSCYKDKIQNPSALKQARILSNYKGLKAGMSFEDFVEWLETPEGSDEFADRHWMSQHKLLEDVNGTIPCHYIGKYENLLNDFDRICDRLSLKGVMLPHSNKHSQIKEEYKSKYSKRTYSIIAQRYKKDIELFDYAF